MSDDNPQQIRRSYSVDKHTQLVDLNGDAVNFKIEFRVSTPDKTPFKMVIVTQDQLDNLEFRSVDSGEMTGDLINGDNVYRSYSLVLKSDKPTVIDVDLNIERYPDFIDLPPAPSQFDIRGKLDSKMIGYICIGLMVLVYVYYTYYNSSNKTKNKSKSVEHKSVLQKLKKMPIE